MGDLTRRSVTCGCATSLYALSATSPALAQRRVGCLGAGARTLSGNAGLSATEVSAQTAAVLERIRQAMPEIPAFTHQLPEQSRSLSAFAVCGDLKVPLIEIGVDAANAVVARSGQQGLLFVFAHEIGHVLQYQADPNLSRTLCEGGEMPYAGRTLELLADCFSGVIFNRVEGQNRRVVLASIAGLADYEFASPEHHGRVTDRLNAFGMGQMADMFGFPFRPDHLLANSDRFLAALGGPSGETPPERMHDAWRNLLSTVFR